jgi:NitT/TauT family transport system permease protein
VNTVRRRRWLFRILFFLAFASLWQLTAWWVQGLLFPSFTATAAAFFALIGTPRLWQALALSHQALVLGFGAAAFLGVGTGFLMGRWRAADAILDPYLTMLLVTPMSALIPVIIIAFGLDLVARALVVMTFAFVVIAINTRAGFRTLDPNWLEMVHSFGASEMQIWWSVVLPGTLPAIVTGLRLGLARAFTGMVAVELLFVAVGVGRLVLDFQAAFEAGAVYATVLVLVAESVILLRALRWLELRLTPWADQVAVE